jgi:hypothetical protein
MAILNDHILERGKFFFLQITFQDVQRRHVANGTEQNAQENYFI